MGGQIGLNSTLKGSTFWLSCPSLKQMAGQVPKPRLNDIRIMLIGFADWSCTPRADPPIPGRAPARRASRAAARLAEAVLGHPYHLVLMREARRSN